MPNSAVKPLILVVEDDPAVRNLIVAALEAHGLRHMAVETAHAAIAAASSQAPSIVLLDLGLPDMDGVKVVESVRAWSGMPIIVVSARSEDFDKVSALDAGADDYLTKPFSVDELLARLRVALRRVRYDGDRIGEESSTYENGDMRIDYSAGCVYISDVEIHLTPIEYKLLCLLAKNTGKVLTHNYILKEVWGSPTASDVSSLRVYMATLRRKLEKNSNGVQYIQTHVGIGYRMLRITNK